MNLLKNRNIKTAFLLLPLPSGIDLFINSLKLRLSSQLVSGLTSTKLYVKFKKAYKIITLIPLCKLQIFTKSFGQSQNKLH